MHKETISMPCSMLQHRLPLPFVREELSHWLLHQNDTCNASVNCKISLRNFRPRYSRLAFHSIGVATDRPAHSCFCHCCYCCYCCYFPCKLVILYLFLALHVIYMLCCCCHCYRCSMTAMRKKQHPCVHNISSPHHHTEFQCRVYHSPIRQNIKCHFTQNAANFFFFFIFLYYYIYILYYI